ncbi:putative ATP-dependent RNA helicase mak-5 [Podospora australis]|uniref:ATP-dependent RNA helicase n=1 Tax=Podospora australis TaxID=1536484 RepID=A0AAN7AHV9_9PEZI|nr:putative ATP-dependent RNA helicase mak-5 [Podospora australis]
MGVDNKKRKRNDGANKRPNKPTSGGGKRQKTEKKVVSVDSLAWKTVDVPEMFDDAEGFYGLEEIEGVEVMKEENGTIRFVAAADKVSKDAETETGGDDGEEFEGFEDTTTEAEAESKKSDSSETAPVKPSKKDQKEPKNPKKDPKAQQKDSQDQKKDSKDQKKDSKEKKQTKEQKPTVDDELESNVFTNLDDLPDAGDEEEVDLSEWAPLDLSSEMLSAIGKLKFSKPTKIQKRAIPEIIKGHDVIGKAATGSGKTLAFGIPIVESWLSKTAAAKKADDKHIPTALILAPTRELAHQITDHLKQLCSGLTNSPYICSVTGGLAVQKQQRQLEKADIIIGTPGRLWEVMSTATAVLNSVKGIDFLVVDEADRLLKDGQFKEAEEILKALDRTVTNENNESDDDESDEEGEPRHHRQTLVFSATFNKNLQQKLAGKARFNLSGEQESLEYLLKKLNFREERPKYIDTNPIAQMAERLTEGLIRCGDLEKDLYLYAVLLLQPNRRALVFTNSINTVRRLTPFLQTLNLPAIALHSDMEQKARLRHLEQFKANPAEGASSPILVATDVAARGLDIPNVDLVIHYHVPRTADDYVHRSGRTARGSNSGVSVLLCGPKEDIPTHRLVSKVHATAAAKSGKPKKDLSGVRTVDIDRRLVSRLRPRVDLSKKITETALAKERGSKEDDWLRKAADELGIEMDDDELVKVGSWKGKGSGRKAKEREAMEVTKAQIKQWRWELRELLGKRVNTGVSERYLSGSDMDALLKGAQSEFLGQVTGLGL